MSKHIIKALEQELETTKIACSKQTLLLSKIEEWLEDEINQYEKYTFDDNHDVADEDVYLSKGRHECAESLLNQIQKWEKEE